MTKEGYAKLTLILSIVAAVLAVSAALVEYFTGGTVNLPLIAGGIFVLAIGFGAKRQMAR
jgi:hypothetical protein